MATHVSSPTSTPYSRPNSPALQPHATGNGTDAPKQLSPGTLTIPPQIERQTTDTFSPSNANATKTPPNTPSNGAAPKFGSHPAQPKFGGKLGAAAGGIGGFAAGAAICWPLAIGAGLLGLLIHPLLPIAGLLGLAPFATAAFGAWMGSGSSKK
jgi:hypothetical protein